MLYTEGAKNVILNDTMIFLVPLASLRPIWLIWYQYLWLPNWQFTMIQKLFSFLEQSSNQDWYQWKMSLVIGVSIPSRSTWYRMCLLSAALYSSHYCVFWAKLMCCAHLILQTFLEKSSCPAVAMQWNLLRSKHYWRASCSSWHVCWATLNWPYLSYISCSRNILISYKYLVWKMTFHLLYQKRLTTLQTKTFFVYN